MITTGDTTVPNIFRNWEILLTNEQKGTTEGLNTARVGLSENEIYDIPLKLQFEYALFSDRPNQGVPDTTIYGHLDNREDYDQSSNLVVSPSFSNTGMEVGVFRRETSTGKSRFARESRNNHAFPNGGYLKQGYPQSLSSYLFGEFP